MALSSTAVAQPTVSRRLANGVTWIHRGVTHNKITAFELFIPGGVSDEPAAKAGLTRLTASVLAKGTKTRGALQIAKEMESMGLAFGLDVQEDYVAIGGQVIADQFPEAFGIFQDVLLNPSFPDDEIEKERAALINAVRTRHEHIFNVAEERFRKEMYGDHPYGRPDEGTEESLAKINKADLAAWHRARFIPEGAVLVTVGALPEKKLKTLVDGFAKSWIWKGKPAGLKPVPPLKAPRVAEEKKSFDQSYLLAGFPAPAVSDPRYAAIKVLNAVMGAGMSSPLFREVREKAGLAYEVSSFYSSRLAGSALVIHAGTDPKNLDNAEAKALDVARGFAKNPVSASDLQDAKNLIRGHYMMDHQTNGRLAWWLGWWQMLGKGYAYDARYPDDVSAVTAEDVHAAAKTLFSGPSVIVRVRSGTAAQGK